METQRVFWQLSFDEKNSWKHYGFLTTAKIASDDFFGFTSFFLFDLLDMSEIRLALPFSFITISLFTLSS